MIRKSDCISAAVVGPRQHPGDAGAEHMSGRGKRMTAYCAYKKGPLMDSPRQVCRTASFYIKWIYPLDSCWLDGNR